MATAKSTTSKKEAEKLDTRKMKKAKYIQSVGRRKEAIARVRLYTTGKDAVSPHKIKINERMFLDYFTVPELRDIASSPLKALGAQSRFAIEAKVTGGGIRGQAEALRLGISRAIVSFDASFKKNLRDLGYLTRDARVVERKKAGLKKARRAPQWQKR